MFFVSRLYIRRGTGLYYCQSRYYDPETGRFLNADAFASTGQGLIGNNMFAYCRNNPVCRVDISGTADSIAYNDGELLSNDELDCRGQGGGGSNSIYNESFKSYQVNGNVEYTHSGYSTSNYNANYSSTYQDISNAVSSAPRQGSALKGDTYHAFPDIVDNYATSGTETDLGNATLYQVAGAYRGIPGRFEWIVQGGFVTHRYFVEGGTINGIPIRP